MEVIKPALCCQILSFKFMIFEFYGQSSGSATDLPFSNFVINIGAWNPMV